MASNTLSSSSVGSTKAQLLHIGTGSLAAGLAVRLGDGTETNLLLSAAGIGFRNAAGHSCNFRGQTSGDIEVNFAGDGILSPSMLAVLAADWSNATTTAETIPAFSLVPEKASLYEVEVILFITPSTTTAKAKFSLEGPSGQTDFLILQYEAPINTTAAASGADIQITEVHSFGIEFLNNQSVPTAGVPYVYKANGWLKTTSTTPATPITIKARPTTASTTIAVKAGSFLKLTKIA